MPFPGLTWGMLQVNTTVSHWTLIHAACHEAARRADARLRVAKSEWEGAALRNSGTLTNNLLPVRRWPTSLSGLQRSFAATASGWKGSPAIQQHPVNDVRPRSLIAGRGLSCGRPCDVSVCMLVVHANGMVVHARLMQGSSCSTIAWQACSCAAAGSSPWLQSCIACHSHKAAYKASDAVQTPLRL